MKIFKTGSLRVTKLVISKKLADAQNLDMMRIVRRQINDAFNEKSDSGATKREYKYVWGNLLTGDEAEERTEPGNKQAITVFAIAYPD